MNTNISLFTETVSANKQPASFFKFHEKLRGFRLTDKFTGKELKKWECFDQKRWEVIASQILNGSHPTIEGVKK